MDLRALKGQNTIAIISINKLLQHFNHYTIKVEIQMIYLKKHKRRGQKRKVRILS